MEPISNERQPEFELPTPAEGLEKTGEKGLERAAAPEKRGEQATTSISPPVSDPQALIAAAQAAATTPAVPAPSAPARSGGMVADDVDLIEKEWVERAKAIVAQTQDDPHAQKSQMSKVKAEYIQKRFNKTVKTDDA